MVEVLDLEFKCTVLPIRANLQPNSKYYVKAPTDTFVTLYITDTAGVPWPVGAPVVSSSGNSFLLLGGGGSLLLSDGSSKLIL